MTNIMDLHSTDSPKRSDYTAKDGDHIWVFTVALDNGHILRLHFGEDTYNDFRSLILKGDIDQAIEGALNNGASENQD